MSNGTHPKLNWTPWHKVVTLRDDVRTGKLSLEEFAADLYDVKLQRGRRPVYEDPKQFFALTYPTTNLRGLARDVVMRLAGKNQKAIRQLELTYGGGKTHTLITLYHLANDPANLPSDLAAVKEFRAAIGLGNDLPRARVVVLPFDKIDAEKGLEDVPDPKGKKRTLRYPWSILAWQLAGADGLRALHAQDKDEERDTPPAEPLIEKLLRLPQKEGLGTLVLIDEVLMYARVMVGKDKAWLETLKSFFQYLCQAVVKADRTAMVASLLATDPGKSDELGKEVLLGISDVLAREKEEGVVPVLKEDVAEVLRRRFFTPDSISQKDRFKEHVIAGLQGVFELDENSRKDKRNVEERFMKSFPFHPELTEVFYGKWTQLDSFQKTRGILRTFALALRDSEKWDQSPFVGPNVFLAEAGTDTVSEAARELTGVATKEQTDGGGQSNWTAILEGELKKARGVQDEFPSLKYREVEQAVFATFVHSQPARQAAKARLDELLVLVGATRPDKIVMEKALRLWFDRSWFLDESAEIEVKGPVSAGASPRPLPVSWRLGAKPNLKQMHSDALQNKVTGDAIDSRLDSEIRKLRSLTLGASAAGAQVHMLPDKPSFIDDDGEFHYAVLGPSAASESGKPSPEARKFLEENTGPNNPRKERNAVVLAVPSKDGLTGAKQAIASSLAWEEVKAALRGQEVDPVRAEALSGYANDASKKVPETIAQAYCIVVTVGEGDDVQAFKIQVAEKSLFMAIKDDRRSRIQDTPISADAILPGGPYDLWRAGEDARRLKDIVGAFARFARLPKMLNRQAILHTIINGCVEGVFVGRLTRPDKSVRTFWRARPEQDAVDEPGFELVLPEKVELAEIAPGQVYPQSIAELWSSPEITVQSARNFFDGTKTIAIDRGGYQEQLVVPKAPSSVVDAAIAAAVRDGKVWLTDGPASLLAEEVPQGMILPTGVLQSPPAPIAPLELLPERLPGAWADGTATALSILTALSQRAGKNLPWPVVRDAIESAFRARVFERDTSSASWPCDFGGAGQIRIRLIASGGSEPKPEPQRPQVSPNTRFGESELKPDQIQDLADAMPELRRVTAGYDLKFQLRVEVAGKKGAPDPKVVDAVNKLLENVNKAIRLQ